MKCKSTVLFLAVAAAALVSVSSRDTVQGGEGKGGGDDAAIRKAVGLYYQGVVDADRKSIERAWDVTSGHMKHVRPGNKADVVAVTQISTAVDWWTRVKAKQSSSEVLSIDVVDGKMASVKFNFVYDKWDYTEFLTLFKLSGQWKIVNKTYVQKIVEK